MDRSVFNLSAPGTIEDEILNRLYRRINLFESYIGNLEAILGNEIVTLTKDLFDPELSDEQRNARIDQVGLLLERRKLQFEEWERSSPQFIGHDEYYRQEVDRAQALGRFIRAEDLASFVKDFVSQYDRRSELAEETPGIFRLQASEKLVQLVVSQPEDPQKGEFCRHLHQNTLRVTFDSDVAERDKDLTFLHVRHFFIRAIVNEYRQWEGQFHPVARVRLEAADSIPAGTYLYLVARATIRAAREQDALLPAIVNLESLQALDEDTSEICLARMVSEGKDSPAFAIDNGVLQRALAAAESVLAERFQARRDSAERLNQAFVDARLASVRQSYRLRIERKQGLLERARAHNQQMSYLRMLEGGIRNLKAEQESREAEIERLRSLTAEHVIIAAGILNVCGT